MSTIRERLVEVRRSEEESSEWAVRVGEVRQRRRAIEEELVRMTGDFDLASDALYSERLSVPELRSKRAALLEELFRIRTGDIDAEAAARAGTPVIER